ncbi:hypothetical protein WN943_022520 [Citrus x changshan-huyou]
MARVANAEQQQMRRLNKVQGWLSRVEAVETEVGELMSDSSQEVDKLCPGGCCSKNCKSSFEFGKRVAKTLQLVNNLIAEGAFDAVAENVPRPAVDQRPCEPIVGLESTFDKVWRCLGEEQVGIIGLYGMGGVGKTTLLTKINNKLRGVPNDFDVMIWVVKNGSLEDKASDILRILSKKKFLLLLDDIWERVDLTKVGVPFPDPENKSKIVFTTRFLEICGATKAHEFLKVECLGPEDAWRLFRDNLRRDVLDNHPDIPELARSVAKEFAGLPLALITIGRAMVCKKTPQEWHHAIQVLRRSSSEFPGMGKEVYPLLKFSYDSLPDDTIRSCLLYCGLFPEDYRIRKSELIDCWIGEGFFYQYNRSGSYNEGYYIIGILLHACLLEEEGGDIGEKKSGEHVVKMHDVIRDMVLWIAYKIEKKENFLVHAGFGLTEAPEIQNWRNVKRMSLMKNKIENLSETPTCPHLLSLFLSDNSLKMIAGLRNLNKLYVAGCKHLEDFQMIVQRSSVNQLAHGFNRLHTVKIGFCFKLRDLTWLVFAPSLKSIVVLSCCHMEQIIKGEKLSQLHHHPERKKSVFEIGVEGCPKLFKLPLDSNSAKGRKVVIKGEENWWNKLQWEDQDTQNAFSSCFKPAVNQRSWSEILN